MNHARALHPPPTRLRSLTRTWKCSHADGADDPEHRGRDADLGQGRCGGPGQGARHAAPVWLSRLCPRTLAFHRVAPCINSSLTPSTARYRLHCSADAHDVRHAVPGGVPRARQRCGVRGTLPHASTCATMPATGSNMTDGESRSADRRGRKLAAGQAARLGHPPQHAPRRPARAPRTCKAQLWRCQVGSDG